MKGSTTFEFMVSFLIVLTISAMFLDSIRGAKLERLNPDIRESYLEGLSCFPFKSVRINETIVCIGDSCGGGSAKAACKKSDILD